MTRNIPIQNIYYMLCYSWNRAEEVKNLSLKGIKGNNFYDLLSLALCNSVSKIIKRGIYKEYIYNWNYVYCSISYIVVGGDI